MSRKRENLTPFDGMVLGLDNDGCLVQYNASSGQMENTGDEVDAYGPEYMSDLELLLVLKDARRLERKSEVLELEAHLKARRVRAKGRG
jgi:hypothetical protein